MPLSLLIPAALLGLAALLIPVVVHLRRRPRTRVVPFPSLMFLEKVPIKADQRRRIHHWALLAIRALALALVVLAFARPFFTGESSLAAVGSGPTERVLLLDRSWSMAAADRWDEALDAARGALADAGPLDRISLVVFDQGGEAVVRSAPDAARVRSALDTLRPGAQATRYGPGLKLAQTILEESELPSYAVVLVSDFQRGGWSGEEGVSFPDGTRVRPVAVGGGPVPNHALAGVTLSRERVEGRERVTPAARITRTGGNGELEVQVALEMDGRPLQARTVTLPAEGATGVVFQPVTLTERHTQLTLRLPGDALPQDDAYHLVLSPGRATRVELVSAPARGTSGDLYLRRALEIGDQEPFEIYGRGTAVPAAPALADRHVLVLNDRPFPTGDEGERIRAWVRDGGGLILVAGDRGRWGADFADLFPGTLGGIVDREDGRGERLAGLDYDHPVFELFRDPRQGDFAAARFYRARAYGVEPGDSVQVLARFDDGTVALAERRVGEGRVLVWSSTLDAFWTDLALKPVFLPFVHRLVRYASGRDPVVDAFTAGQVLDVADVPAMESAGLGEVAEALAASEERVALTPDGGSRALDAAAPFLALDQAGFFQIRPPGQDGVRPVTVAVNVEREEADLTPMDPDEIVAAVGGAVGAGNVAEGAPATAEALRLRREDQERRQSLWRYLLVGALGLLVLESIIANRLSRRGTTGGRHARASG
ncbi:MAG TPA: BatA domain-containing protein [Longimicrobiales bacterium]|nr:BatA domain-containing protein [Longimicrobiales bacterium]